jgi:tetratricopeptide (TPR) repeat protein
LLRSAWEVWKDSRSTRLLLKSCAALLVILPTMPLIFAPFGHTKWFEHDRSHNWIARNYGYNILASLPPNAILATNGDNDTFPLWYLQQVEGFRTDVRVVNLSLINLGWYIKQLRDYEPKVPIAWNDAQIDGKEDIQFRKYRCRLEAERFPDGEVAWIRDKTMWHIVKQNDWKRPIYYAVTVPNRNIGMFIPYLRMEGLVYRLTPTRSDDDQPTIDRDEIWKNFTEVYDFRSVLDADGKADSTVYRDPQSAHLLRNYPAALSRVGYFAAKDGKFEEALKSLEFAQRLEPTFPLVGDVLPYVYARLGRMDDAERVADDFLKVDPDPVKAAVDVGEAYLQLLDKDNALRWARELYQRNPTVPEYTQLYVRSLILNERDDDAGQVIEDWAAATGDTRAREEFQHFLEERDARAARDSTAVGLGAPPDSSMVGTSPR